MSIDNTGFVDGNLTWNETGYPLSFVYSGHSRGYHPENKLLEKSKRNINDYLQKLN